MQICRFVVLSGASSLIACANAQAEYLGVGMTHQIAVAGGVQRSVYRVYAVFDDPDDYLVSVGGDEANPLHIISLNFISFPGPDFFNPGGVNGNTAPSSPGSSMYWGTYATIGVSDATQGSGGSPSSPIDETMLSPDFPNFIAGNQLYSTSMSWFTNGPVEQARAGGPNGVLGTFFRDFTVLTGMGVLMAQLTVNAGQNVCGTVNVSGISDGAEFTDNGVQFGSLLSTPHPPAPGSLALVAIAGTYKSRRRRYHGERIKPQSVSGGS